MAEQTIIFYLRHILRDPHWFDDKVYHVSRVVQLPRSNVKQPPNPSISPVGRGGWRTIIHKRKRHQRKTAWSFLGAEDLPNFPFFSIPHLHVPSPVGTGTASALHTLRPFSSFNRSFFSSATFNLLFSLFTPYSSPPILFLSLIIPTFVQSLV